MLNVRLVIGARCFGLQLRPCSMAPGQGTGPEAQCERCSKRSPAASPSVLQQGQDGAPDL